MWIQVPDANPMMGGMNFTDPSVVQMAKSIIKEHKAERKKKKEEEDKKKEKNKPKLFTLLETTGLILLLSIPITVAQLQALEYIKVVLTGAFK